MVRFLGSLGAIQNYVGQNAIIMRSHTNLEKISEVLSKSKFYKKHSYLKEKYCYFETEVCRKNYLGKRISSTDVRERFLRDLGQQVPRQLYHYPKFMLNGWCDQ